MRGSEALGVQDQRNMVVVRNIGVSLDVCFGLFWHIGSLVPSRLDKSKIHVYIYIFIAHIHIVIVTYIVDRERDRERERVNIFMYIFIYRYTNRLNPNPNWEWPLVPLFVIAVKTRGCCSKIRTWMHLAETNHFIAYLGHLQLWLFISYNLAWCSTTFSLELFCPSLGNSCP